MGQRLLDDHVAVINSDRSKLRRNFFEQELALQVCTYEISKPVFQSK